LAVDPEQLHAAFQYCADFAKRMLEAEGSFFPFGATLSASGEVKAAAAWNGEDHPKPADVYQFLIHALRAEAKSNAIAGAAIAVDVNIPPAYQAQWPDGVRVRLESTDYSRYIYLPYSVKLVGLLRRKREVSFAEAFSVEIGPEIFSR
jgi:hypothetical protein